MIRPEISGRYRFLLNHQNLDIFYHPLIRLLILFRLVPDRLFLSPRG